MRVMYHTDIPVDLPQLTIIKWDQSTPDQPLAYLNLHKLCYVGIPNTFLIRGFGETRGSLLPPNFNDSSSLFQLLSWELLRGI